MAIWKILGVIVLIPSALWAIVKLGGWVQGYLESDPEVVRRDGVSPRSGNIRDDDKD